MRKAFIKTLIELAEKDDRIYVLTGDLGFKVFEEFSQKFPDRFINCGVAEQNMMGVAAGLAMSGKKPYVYSIVPFVTLRCLEQIRNDVCYQNLDVKIIGIGGGFSYGTLGATHSVMEDVAVMRALPNMTVLCPSDLLSTEELMIESYRTKSPTYIRLSNIGQYKVYDEKPGLQIGKVRKIKDGKDALIVATGLLLPFCLDIIGDLGKHNIGLGLLDFHTLKPIDKNDFWEKVKDSPKIITFEEHSAIGGTGSAVADVLSEFNYTGNLKKFAVPDEFFKEIGSTEYLRKKYIINKEQVIKDILNYLNIKNMKNKVPFVNYPLQYKNQEKEIDGAIKRVLVNGDLILRQDVEDFEKNMAGFLGVEYGVGVNSCTDALILSLRAAGIKEGDEVITVSHTFFATIEAIRHCQATPVLVEVGEDFVMDVSKVEQAITGKTKAIIPVHLNGHMVDMEKLMEIAKKHNLIVIEDAAQALGATLNGKMAGSFGLAGCFSFYPAKLLGAYGDAGIVCTDNADFAEKVRLLRNHGVKSKTEIVLYGFTSRLDNLQAAVLNVKFKCVPQWIERRQKIAEIYKNGLSGTGRIKLPPDSGIRFYDVFQNYVIRAEKRDELFNFLKEKGVETLIKDAVPNHFHKDLGLSHFKLPLTEQLSKEVISLPMYPELTDEQMDYVMGCIKEFYKP